MSPKWRSDFIDAIDDEEEEGGPLEEDNAPNLHEKIQFVLTTLVKKVNSESEREEEDALYTSSFLETLDALVNLVYPRLTGAIPTTSRISQAELDILETLSDALSDLVSTAKQSVKPHVH